MTPASLSRGLRDRFDLELSRDDARALVDAAPSRARARLTRREFLPLLAHVRRGNVGLPRPPPPLPAGWESRRTRDGDEYYEHESGEIAAWHPARPLPEPSALASRRGGG